MLRPCHRAIESVTQLGPVRPTHLRLPSGGPGWLPPEAKFIYRQRASHAEWTNALARNRGLQHLAVRGLARVRAIFLWFALAHTVAQGLLLVRRAEVAA